MARLAQFRSQHPGDRAAAGGLDQACTTWWRPASTSRSATAAATGTGSRRSGSSTTRSGRSARPPTSPGASSLARVDDLLDETLLHLSQFDRNWVTWPAWLAAQGVKAAPTQARPRVRQLPRPAAGRDPRRGHRPVRRPAGRGLHRPRRPGPPDRGDARAPTAPSTSSTRKGIALSDGGSEVPRLDGGGGGLTLRLSSLRDVLAGPRPVRTSHAGMKAYVGRRSRPD